MLLFFEERVRDHLRIRRTEIERTRHKAKGAGGRPPKNNIEHGQGLGDKIEVVIRSNTFAKNELSK